MAKCKGPVNRLVMHRARGLSGPLAQNIGGGKCATGHGYSYSPGGANYGATLIGASISNASQDEILLTFNGDLTATTAACGWTYSVNGGIDTAPTLAAILNNTLTLTMGAAVACADAVTVSYASAGCDLAVDGEAFEDVTDRTVSNGVNTPLPVITVQPTNQAVTEPAAATFSLTATGATGYQWRLNGTDIPGATNSSYTTPATVDGQTGNYDCRVTNDCGGVLSDAATLTVTAALPVFDGVIANMTSTVGTPMTPYDASVHFGTGGAVASYSLTGAPAWMSIGATTGIITGTPDAMANTLGIEVKGTNSGGSASSNAWNMDAQAALEAPVFSGTIANMTSTVGTPITPYDASTHFSTGGAVASYSLQNAPAWMSINASTGEITGTPDAVAVTAGITVTGTNATGSDVSNAWQMDAQAAGAIIRVHDTFTDVNGTAVIAHTPDIDLSAGGYALFVNVGDVADIQSNTVKYLTTTQFSAQLWGIQTAIADGYAELDVTNSDRDGFHGILFRVQDTDNYWALLKDGTTGDGIDLIEKLATVDNTRGSGGSWLRNSRITLGCEYTDELIIAYVADVEIFRYASASALKTATNAGFRVDSNSANDNGGTLHEFEVRSEK